MINEYEIISLLDSQKEGPYWDFKQVWYDTSTKSCMLHDIICMVNNLVYRDAYIIIGIGEEDGKFSVAGVDVTAYTTETLTDFLMNAKFAGNNIPKVEVESVEIESKKS